MTYKQLLDSLLQATPNELAQKIVATLAGEEYSVIDFTFCDDNRAGSVSLILSPPS